MLNVNILEMAMSKLKNFNVKVCYCQMLMLKSASQHQMSKCEKGQCPMSKCEKGQCPVSNFDQFRTPFVIKDTTKVCLHTSLYFIDGHSSGTYQIYTHEHYNYIYFRSILERYILLAILVFHSTSLYHLAISYYP